MAKKTKKEEKLTAEKSGVNALNSLLDRVNKKHGAGAIMCLEEDSIVKVPCIPTGSISIDSLAVAIGGIPRGRITEVYGPESSGKTTIALQTIAQAQKLDGLAAFIDAEHALDPTYARALGVDTKKLLIAQPDCGEQALTIAQELLESRQVDIIVIDSVAALIPRAELEGEMGAVQMGLQARLLSQAMRKLVALISKSKTALIMVNQLRAKIQNTPFGNPETTTGGNALKFYATVRIDIRSIGKLRDGDNHYGNRVRIKVVKNKLAPPHKKCEVDMIFGKGIAYENELIDLATELEVITKKGSWFSYDGVNIGQGKDQTIMTFNDNPEMVEKIDAEVRAKLNSI